MSGIVALAVVVGIAAIVVAALQAKTGRASEAGEWPYYAKKPLSAPEQILYLRLSGALPQHMVLAQVGLSRLLGVKKGSSFHAWNNRINRMSVDFVVCSQDSSIVAVIELDDASHARDDRRIADAKKDRAITAAGIRIIRWQAKALPDEASIKAHVLMHQAPPVSAAKTEPVATTEHSRTTSRRAS